MSSSGAKICKGSPKTPQEQPIGFHVQYFQIYLPALNHLTFCNYRKNVLCFVPTLSTHQCHDVICQVPGKIWSNKTGQASQCNSSIILVRATQVLEKEKHTQTFQITHNVKKQFSQPSFIRSTVMKRNFTAWQYSYQL